MLGTRPTNDISIEFKNDHNEILHTARQCYYLDMRKLLWSAEYVMNKSITKFHW